MVSYPQCDEFLGVATLATAAAVTTEPAPASGADLVPAVDAAATVAGLDAAVEAQRLLPRIGALAVDRVAICAMIKGAILSNLDNIPAAVACYEWIVARDKTIVRER